VLDGRLWAADRREVGGDRGRVCGEAAQRVRRHGDRVVIPLEVLGDVDPARAVSPGAVHQHDRRPDRLLRLGRRRPRPGRGTETATRTAATSRMAKMRVAMVLISLSSLDVDGGIKRRAFGGPSHLWGPGSMPWSAVPTARRVLVCSVMEARSEHVTCSRPGTRLGGGTRSAPRRVVKCLCSVLPSETTLEPRPRKFEEMRVRSEPEKA
jgi:hypothetical protein